MSDSTSVILWISYKKKCANHCCREPTNENKQFKKIKHEYLIFTWSDKAFNGTVLHWGMPSSHGGLLVFTQVNMVVFAI